MEAVVCPDLQGANTPRDLRKALTVKVAEETVTAVGVAITMPFTHANGVISGRPINCAVILVAKVLGIRPFNAIIFATEATT